MLAPSGLRRGLLAYGDSICFAVSPEFSQEVVFEPMSIVLAEPVWGQETTPD